MRRALMLLLPVVLAAAALASRSGVAQTPPEVPLTLEQHRFQPEEIRVKAGAPFVLVITNKDATPEEFESKDLHMEKVVPGSKTLRLRMPALKAGTYGFFGDFHAETAKGRIIAE